MATSSIIIRLPSGNRTVESIRAAREAQVAKYMAQIDRSFDAVAK